MLALSSQLLNKTVNLLLYHSAIPIAMTTMQEYIKYAIFDEYVAQKVGAIEYQCNKHILPTIALVHRKRFMQIAERSTHLPTCNDLLKKAAKLPEHHFLRFLSFIKHRTLS